MAFRTTLGSRAQLQEKHAETYQTEQILIIGTYDIVILNTMINMEFRNEQ